MSMKKFRYNNSPNNPYERHDIYLPRETWEYLKKLSEETKLSASRLINYAIDHERDEKNPFNYVPERPLVKYVQHAYIEEANKLRDFIRKFRNGISLDALQLMRRDMGLPSKETFMCAYRELSAANQVDLQAPPMSAYRREQPNDCLFVVLTSSLKQQNAPKKKSELKIENEKLMKEIQRLKGQK